MASSTSNDRLALLEERWAEGTLTEAEAIEYSEWYNARQDEIVIIPHYFAASEPEHRHRLLEKISRQMERSRGLSIGRVSPAAAAAVFLAIAIATVFYFHPLTNKKAPATVKTATQQPPQILPGRTKASLQLADGQMLQLDSTADGLIARQGLVKIMMRHGSLAYENQGHPIPVTFNTLYTHNGEQYHLTLSDGTKVWLNAASSLRFPVEFSGAERRVELSGEAYFEVAKDAGHPFFVHSAGQEISVLGTHFDVDTYADDGAIETTVLEGEIRINQKTDLLPGQQSRLTKDGITVTSAVDVAAAVAWKNGRFNFSDADISVIMRQLERWYDIQVVFEGGKISDRFYGTIPRSATLDQVLRMLQNNRVHFDLEGRRLTIFP